MTSNLDALEFVFAGPTPALIQTYRKDGTAKLSPVWFRLHDDCFEVVIAEDDIKLKHLQRDPRVTLLIFETAPPFRGVQVTTEVTWASEGLDEARRSISSGTSVMRGPQPLRKTTGQRGGGSDPVKRG